jgi:hypothetical protein
VASRRNSPKETQDQDPRVPGVADLQQRRGDGVVEGRLERLICVGPEAASEVDAPIQRRQPVLIGDRLYVIEMPVLVDR